jgi:hypothetical protein
MAMDWGKAFAIQACSDFAARDHLLAAPDLPMCHQLHYLQMALEKVAKAHLIAAGSDPLSLMGSHAYVAKVIPTIVRDGLGRTGTKEGWIMEAVRSLARRIELLHPAVDGGRSVPANCEYPWVTAAGTVVAPADHDFRLDLHSERAAKTLIKEARIRAEDLAGRR